MDYAGEVCPQCGNKLIQKVLSDGRDVIGCSNKRCNYFREVDAYGYNDEDYEDTALSPF